MSTSDYQLILPMTYSPEPCLDLVLPRSGKEYRRFTRVLLKRRKGGKLAPYRSPLDWIFCVTFPEDAHFIHTYYTTGIRDPHFFGNRKLLWRRMSKCNHMLRWLLLKRHGKRRFSDQYLVAHRKTLREMPTRRQDRCRDALHPPH